MTRPDADLLLAFRGTAAFLRRFNILAEEGRLTRIGPPESIAFRRRVIASVGYSARAFATFAEGLRTGRPEALSTLLAECEERVALGLSLPVRGLEHLAVHSAVHLRVEWRDLPDDLWDTPVDDPAGGAATARETVSRRADEVWAAAVALGTRRRDLPPITR